MRIDYFFERLKIEAVFESVNLFEQKRRVMMRVAITMKNAGLSDSLKRFIENIFVFLGGREQDGV